jgi:tripartite ATP-independent transporter DctM subunit
MSLTTLAACGIVVMVALVFIGMDLGTAMFLVGLVGYTLAAGDFARAFQLFRTVPFTTAASYTFSVIPLFVLMGEFALQSGMSRGLYDACERWLGRFPGGLSFASVVSCGLFGAICGSSSATVATMGRLALPEMRARGYDDGFSAATVAAGGTLSWLIPPSTGFILYGITASVSVGRLFAAGVVPGVLLMIAFMGACAIACKRNPALAPRGKSYTPREKLVALSGLIPIVAMFTVVIGGMFSGIFAATEAAAIGAIIAVLYALIRRSLTWRSFLDRLLSTLKSSLMVFQIMMGAYVFGYFLTITNLPQNLAAFIAGLAVNRYVIILFMFLLYIVIGMFMDTLSAVLITIPIFNPIVLSLGFDPVWFGVIVVLVMVLGTITPPIGINLFIAAGLDRNLSLPGIYGNIVPYCIALVIVTIAAIFIPALSTWLPNLIYGLAAG